MRSKNLKRITLWKGDNRRKLRFCWEAPILDKVTMAYSSSHYIAIEAAQLLVLSKIFPSFAEVLAER